MSLSTTAAAPVPPSPPPKRSLAECHRILTAPGMPWEMEHKQINGRSVRVYKQVPNSVREFWHATKVRPFASAVYARRLFRIHSHTRAPTQAHGAKDCVVYEGERYSYQQAHDKVQRLARLFHDRGVRKGDRVAIAMRNLPEWIFSFFAAHELGAVAVAVNAWLSPEALAHVLTLTEPKLAIVDEERASLFRQQLSGTAGARPKSLIVVRAAKGQTPQGFERYEDALETVSARDVPPVEIRPEVRISFCRRSLSLRPGADEIAKNQKLQDPAILFLTSGTTSLPKAVLSTQRQFLTNRFNTSIGQSLAQSRFCLFSRASP